MNSPEEKAKELVEKFRNELSWIEKDYTVDLWRDARQCAIIAVDEIIDALEDIKEKVDDSSLHSIDNRIREYESVKMKIKMS